MNENLINLTHLCMAARETKELSAQVASAAAEAIEEMARCAVTMQQVNTAIQAAVLNSWEASY